MHIKNKRVVVTGGSGFLGRWVIKALQKEQPKDIIIPRSKNLDLTIQKNCEKIARDAHIIIHLAAYVGGIGLNQKHPGRLFYDNALMGIQLIEAARKYKVSKMLITGTACLYPKNAQIPFQEKNIWDGYPEKVTGMYGMAKKMLLVQAQGYREEYGLNTIYLIPTNLYGPGDNHNPESGHVIPSLIYRMVQAKKKNKREFVVWGTGRATRDFLYAEDAAEAIVQAIKHYDKPEPINIGSGTETPIRNLVQLLKKHIGYKGKIVWDSSKPDGQQRRLMDIAQAKKAFFFKPKTSLEQGLQRTIEAYSKKFS